MAGIELFKWPSSFSDARAPYRQGEFVVESPLGICFLSCRFAGTRLPRPSRKPASEFFLTLAYPLGSGCLL